MTKRLMMAFYRTLFFNLLIVVLSIVHLEYAISVLSPQYNSTSSFDNRIEENLKVIKAMPLNNTNPSSITVDPISDLVYVSVRPDYSSNYLSQSCSGESNVTSKNLSDSSYTCSVIYVLDGETDQIIYVIRLGPGEEIHDIDMDPRVDRIYATGEYNYRADNSEGNGEQIQYQR